MQEQYTPEQICEILYHSCGHALMIEMGCGHTVILATALPAPTLDMLPLTVIPCAWCFAAQELGRSEEELLEQYPHIHITWKKGAAVVSRSDITVDEQRMIQEMEKEFNGGESV